MRIQAPAARATTAIIGAAFLAVVAASSCDKENKPTPPDPGESISFMLQDVNPNSPTGGEAVSAEQFRGKRVVLLAGSAG